MVLYLARERVWENLEKLMARQQEMPVESRPEKLVARQQEMPVESRLDTGDEDSKNEQLLSG